MLLRLPTPGGARRYLSILLVLAGSAHAHLPELFGREYVLADRSVEKLVPPAAAPAGDLAPYLAELDAQESEAGPYAEVLSETYSGLAHNQLRAGAFPEAIEAYKRALHSIRVNEGLLSPRQLPVLEQLIIACEQARDFECLDASHDYRLHLYRRAPGLDVAERRRSELEYLRWQRAAYTARVDGRARNRLLHAYLNNQAMLDELAAGEVFDTEAYRALLHNQLLNLYLVMSDRPIEEESANVSTGQRHGGHPASEDFVRHQISLLQLTAISQGRRLLLDFIERATDLPVEERAALVLELGDWYQWNGKLRNARDQYLTVVDLLTAAGREDLLEQWLGEPHELPDEEELWLEPPDSVTEIELSYLVSDKGNASAVEVVSAPEINEGLQAKIKRMLRDSHFRPRYGADGAQAAAVTGRRYQLLN